MSNNKYNRNIKSILNSFTPDIVFTNNLSGFSTNIWSIARELNIKIVHTLRDYYLQCSKTTKFKNGENCKNICLGCNLLSRIKKRNSDNVDFLVGISKYILDDHINNGFFKEIPKNVIYNGFDLPFEKEKNNNLKTITFGFIGQLNISKGIELILESFNSIKETNWRLLIAGKASDKYINKLRDINNSGNITFLGYTESSSFFKTIDVLIAPSIWNEPFGRVVIESIFNNTPILGSLRGGLTELLSNNPAFIIEPTVEHLCNFLKKTISTPEFLDTFIFDETFNNKFQIREIAEKYLNTFKMLISK